MAQYKAGMEAGGEEIMTMEEAKAFDEGVLKAHREDLAAFTAVNSAVSQMTVKLHELRQENAELRESRWHWFLAFLAASTAMVIGWAGLIYVTRIG